MKGSNNALYAYLSQFGSIKILVWVVALGVITLYGLLGTDSHQPVENLYLQQGQYTQPLQQPAQQTSQYPQGSQQFPQNSQQQQMQQHGGYSSRSSSNDPSNNAITYPNSQGADYQQKEPLNYGY